MKSTDTIILLAIIATGLTSCLKPNGIQPVKPVVAKSDTSTTLINNTSLVGNWNIVTDTVSFEVDTMYHGTATDHYIFTKYGNLYIKSAFYNYTDTAVYSISGIDTLRWINSYYSEGGSAINESGSKNPSSVGTYTITSISPHSLILTQEGSDGITPDGRRYEQITFKK